MKIFHNMGSLYLVHFISDSICAGSLCLIESAWVTTFKPMQWSVSACLVCSMVGSWLISYWRFFSLHLIVRLLVSSQRSFHNLYIYTSRNTEYQSHRVCQYMILSSHLRLFWPPPHICRHVGLHYKAVCFYHLNIYISLNIVVVFYLHMDNALLSHYFHLPHRTPVTLISHVGHSGEPLHYWATLHWPWLHLCKHRKQSPDKYLNLNLLKKL